MWVIPKSWKQLLFLHVTITSSFWGLCSFHQMLNKSKYCTPGLLLQEVAACTHTYTHVRTHTPKPFFVKCLFCVLFSVRAVLLLKVIQKGIDYKGGLILHSFQKGCKNKRPSVAMWIRPPYHFIKTKLNAFFCLWSQSGRRVSLSRAFGGECTSLMCFNKHDLDCSLVLFWSVEMSLFFFNSLSAGLIPVGNVPALQTKSALWLAPAVSDKTLHF